MQSLLIFCKNPTARLVYVCKLVFKQHLGLAYSVTDNEEDFKKYTYPKLWYAPLQLYDGVCVEPVSLLFEDITHNQHIKTGLVNGLNVPFYTGTGTFKFDVFAAIFYLVTRYEEHLPFTPNQYGQFKATDSLAYKLNFLKKPVVDIWIAEVKKILQASYPSLVFKQKTFTATFTYDIDVAYKFKGRTFLVTFLNSLIELITLQHSKLLKRMQVLTGVKADPFDTYQHIATIKEKYKHQLIYFFLLGEKNNYNKNLNPYQKIMQLLMQQSSENETVGIHPSYYANDDYLQLQYEKILLQTIIKKSVSKSRQHYLRMIFPNTYLNLIAAGITDDYSLGFAESPGFRAGTCTAFNFYNLKAEVETNLTLHPNTFMEGTFAEDLRLSPSESFDEMRQLVDEVKKVNGQFICIWHNHSLSNEIIWEGFKNVHDAIAAYAANGK
jgi:hypothetical protein